MLNRSKAGDPTATLAKSALNKLKHCDQKRTALPMTLKESNQMLSYTQL